MKAAVQLLAQSGAGRKTIAVLGDMLELGSGAIRMHEEVGAFVAQQGISQLIACGTLGRGLAEGARRAGMEQVKNPGIGRCRRRRYSCQNDGGLW